VPTSCGPYVTVEGVRDAPGDVEGGGGGGGAPPPLPLPLPEPWEARAGPAPILIARMARSPVSARRSR
jgi:hypothetical protein